MINENNPNFGKSLSVETKALISKGMIDKNNSIFGTTRSEGTKAKLSKNMELLLTFILLIRPH
jgi:hypothetical protein